MRQIIFLLTLILPVLAIGQSYEYVQLNDSTWVVKPVVELKEDADTTKTADEAWAISYNEAHGAAVRFGRAYTQYLQELKAFNRARSGHDARFPDSTYFDFNEISIGQRLLGAWKIRVQGGGGFTDAQVRYNNANNLRFEDLAPGTAAGGLRVVSYNVIDLQNYFTGETVRLTRDQGRDLWRGENAASQNVVLRKM